MNTLSRTLVCYSLLIFSLASSAPAAHRPPRLTVVFVVDGLSSCTLTKVRPYLQGGIGRLLGEGLSFANAHHPHAMPATAPGHTGLSTGTIPKNHGIVGNYWYDPTATKKIYCDSDSPDRAAVFSPDGFYSYGRSARNILVDGISDQLMLQGKPHHNTVIALSIKSRAAISMANKLGKAIWFDRKSGSFTTSKAYFNELPRWLISFNSNQKIPPPETISWKLAHPMKSNAYNFDNVLNDTYASYNMYVQNNTLSITRKSHNKKMYDSDQPYDFFAKTPQANVMLFDLAKKCVDVYLDKTKPGKMLLWISLSAHDKLGHLFGRDALATLDILYHMNNNIKNFMAFLESKLPPHEILYVLTSDHGNMPIPELLAKKGFPALRLEVNKLTTSINTMVKERYGLDNLIKKFKTPHFFIDEVQFAKLPKKDRTTLTRDLQSFLQVHPGIKNAWTRTTLQKLCLDPYSFEKRYQQQLYPSRSGFLTFQVHPYVYLSRHKTGTGHRTPYHYDTQVPLIFYRKGIIRKRRIAMKVWTPQVATTLAYLLNVPKPSTSTFAMLPCIQCT